MSNEIQGLNFTLGEQSSILTTGTKAVKYFPWNMKLKEVYVTLMTAPTVAAVTVDILKNGTSILTNKMTIAVGSYTSRGTELINNITVYEADQLAFVVLTTDVSASILECNIKYEVFEDAVGSTHPVTPSVYTDIYTSSDVVPEGVSYSNIAYVDNKRTDTYVADGSLNKPYKTILAAVNAVNALALAHQTANTYTKANYIIDVSPGTYTDDFTITNVKNLRFNMTGVYNTGNIVYNTTMVGGTADNYYSRLEFVGTVGPRPEKGPSGRLSGTFTATRNNDSLSYITFSGIDNVGNIIFNTNGTWVLQIHNGLVTGNITANDLALILLETTGYTKIKGHIAATDGSSVTAASLYTCDNTEFDLINISNATGSRITNCRFASTVTITGGTISVDAISYKAILAQTPTLTGSTLSYLDFNPNVSNTYYVDGNRTDTYTPNGSILYPYKDIDAALDVINVLSAAHQVASTYDQANYVIDVQPGVYDEALSIGNVKNLRFNLHGATISGNITYTTTMVGGSADYYYSRLEFVGCEGNRAEKGTAARLTGTFTATRNNDSLCYVSFKGVHIAGNMLYKTNGTWILSLKDVFFSAYLYTEDLALVLLETTGHTEFGAYSGTGTGHISVPSTDAVVAVSLYNVDNTEFDLLNISNAAGSRITNCRFKSNTTITAGNINIDAISYKALEAITETLSGATVIPLDGILPTATTLGFFTGGTQKWSINASNTLIPEVDNSYDIGNLAVNPRDIHSSRAIIKKGIDSTGGYGYLSIKSISASKTLTNAQTNTLAIQIPTNAKLIGVQLRNDTLIAGVDDATGLVPITTYSAIYATGATQTINATIAVAANTKVDKFFDSNAATDITSAATDITLDSGAGNKFTAGGIISAVAYYYDLTSISSL